MGLGDRNFSDLGLNSIAKAQKLAELSHLLEDLTKNHDLTEFELQKIYKSTSKINDSIPLSIFNNDALSALEAITKYLREDISLPYKQIASLLDRNQGPIGITFRSAKKKMPRRLDIESDIRIPLKIFRTSNSILESLVGFMKDTLSMNYSQIARALHRDPRTIWTIYRRYSKDESNR